MRCEKGKRVGEATEAVKVNAGADVKARARAGGGGKTAEGGRGDSSDVRPPGCVSVPGSKAGLHNYVTCEFCKATR